MTEPVTSLWFAVLGSPVAHSKSPAMHAAAYRALDLPHAYERIETSETELPERIEALRDGKYAGFNVTIPHKLRVLDLVDEIDESAKNVGAANTLVRTPQGKIRAYNTDVGAIEAELARLANDATAFRGKSAIVLGTGGAARAAISALTTLGAKPIIVRGRNQGSLANAPLEAPDAEPKDLRAVIQATSCGMEGAAPGSIVANAVAWETVPKEAIALDLVYAPPVTPFLEKAAQRGLVNDCGYGMLARQGALAFELWLGIPAPFEAMLETLRERE